MTVKRFSHTSQFFMGTSEDTKPTGRDVELGAEFWEKDTDTTFTYTDTGWVEGFLKKSVASSFPLPTGASTEAKPDTTLVALAALLTELGLKADVDESQPVIVDV